jgi:non-canonical purine NTP pyrophosphatase (RdgB/HAM1 family)
MKDITFVSGNKNKVKEVEQILGVTLEIADIDIEEMQGLDLEKVALHKLDQAYKQIKKPVMIDDVSVIIHAWNNFPGPLIKWVLQASNGTPQMLLKMLQEEKDRRATAILAVGFADENVKKIFYGEITGVIGTKIEGENGFGWDKVFIPDGYTTTLACLSSEEKNSISHRGKALAKFSEFIHSNYKMV